MPMKVLLACKHVPYFGGDTTECYLLFKHLARLGYDVHYLNLVERGLRDMLRVRMGERFLNPDSLPNVSTCYVESLDEGTSPAPGPVLDRIRPDLIVGFNHAAPHLLRRHVPDTPIWFVPSSCYAKRNAIGAGTATEQDLRALAESAPGLVQGSHEVEAGVVRHVERVLCGSIFTRFWFQHFYPEDSHKLHDPVLSSAPLLERELAGMAAAAPAFEERGIDLLFVAVNWLRPEKGIDLLRAIVRHVPGRSVHVVGECPEEFNSVTYHQLTTRTRVIELMSNAKAVVSTSTSDAAPLVLAEAAALGANVVASRNCGNHALCHPDLLADPYSLDVYVRKVLLAVERRYENRMDRFRPLDLLGHVARLIDGNGRGKRGLATALANRPS